MPDLIHVVITGGTIDSVYDGIHDTVKPAEQSIVPEYIESLKPEQKFQFTTICMKDSRELTQADRQKILEVIESSQATQLIVTHGTYTMADTARYLKANLKRDNQTIVFTGAMIPIKGFSPSDGGFNLGYAVAQVGYLNPGLYVAMNAQVFSPDEVTKLLDEGRFSSVFNK